MISWRADWPKHVAAWGGTIAGALGAAVLAAWYAHYIPLIQITPNLTPMRRNTAFEFLLCGMALVFLTYARRLPARVLALVAASISGLTILQYVLGVDLGIDQLLGTDYVIGETNAPGRMSPVSALCFLATSVAIMVLSRRRRAKYAPAIAGILGSMVVAVAAIGLFGYAVGNQTAFAWGHFARVALHTAVGLCVLGSGTLAAAWQASEMNQARPRWLPLSLGLGIASGAIGMWQALMVHGQGQLRLLSYLMLAAGLAGAVLVATAVRQTQKATLRSRQLQEGKEAFERLFEASLDGLLVVDGAGRIVSANQRVQDIFGYTREEIVGSVVDTLVPIPLVELHRLHREDYYANARTRSMGKGLELNGRHKDGSEFPVDVSLSPLQSHGELQVLAAVRDIAERKRAEEALRQSEARFRGIFETSPLGLALIQPDYRLAKVNSSLCRMSGYSEAEVLALNPFELTHPDDREKSKILAMRLFNGEIPSYQIDKRYVKKNGEIIWVTLTATILRDTEGRWLLGLGMVEDITERKIGEEALRQSEERFRGLIEQGPIGITLIDRDYRLIQVNAALCRMLGYTERELTSMTPLDFTHPDDRGVTVQETERLFKAEAPLRNMEKRYVKKSGEVIWGSVTASVIHDKHGKPIYAMGMIEDITERKRAGDELRALTQRLALATRSASMGVWELNVSKDVAIWDDMMFQIFGIPKKAEVAREDWARVFHPDDIPKTERFIKTIVRGKRQNTIEFRIISPRGSLRHVSSAGGPVLDESGNVTGAVGIAVDITERKQLEQELEAAREQAIVSARLSALGMMAGGVAHEINNPLSIIHSMASDLGEMAADQGSVPPQVLAHKSRVIRETAERIAKIVKSLRQISREGSADPLRWTSVSKIVAETLEICRAKFTAHGVELLLPRSIPDVRIPCREVQIAQAVLNLLQNAFDATVEQEGERWVRLDVKMGDGMVVLSVTDSGPGIPSEIQAHVMEPFFTTKPVGKGTGLGLSLSKTIAEDHGGSLEYSEDHGHTCFSLALPLARKAEAA